MMEKVFQFFFRIFARIYIYCALPVMDLIMNLYYFLKTLPDYQMNKRREMKFLIISAFNTRENEKDDFLKNIYSYRRDPLKGFLNWDWRFLYIAAAKGFIDDCDGFAFLAHWMYRDGIIYSILKYGLKKEDWKTWHVVYYRPGKQKVYSSGRIHNMTFEKYLSLHFPFEKFVVKIPARK
jgi:hypothetical protein